MPSLRIRGMAVALAVVAAGSSLFAAPAHAAPGKLTLSLTFDDGLANQIENAVPVLNANGVKGTFYIVSRRIGGNGIMTEGQIKGLQAGGHEVGGHTVSHGDLNTKTLNEVRDELCNSRQDLKALGVRITSIAYPFGHANDQVKQAARDCGYNGARGVGPIRLDGGPVPADTLPAADPYQVRTPESFKNTTTLDQMKTYVNNAVNKGGGWLPVNFHTICAAAPCADQYGVGKDLLDDFVKWAKAEPNVEIKTMGAVFGGDDKPAVPGPSRSADLKVAVEGPAQAKSGAQVAYTVATTNTGGTAANGVKTVVNLPALSGITAPGGCAIAGTTVTCDQGTLYEIGGEKKAVITGKIAGAVGANLKVTASATTASTEWAVPNNAEFGTVILKPNAALKADMAVTATTVGPLKSKKVAKLKVTLVNRGSGAAKKVVLVAKLPSGLKILAVKGCKKYGKHAIKCSAKAFKPGQTHTIWVKFRSPKLKKSVKATFKIAVATSTPETRKANNKVNLVRRFLK